MGKSENIGCVVTAKCLRRYVKKFDVSYIGQIKG